MEFLKNTDSRLKAVFFSVLFGMIVAHGMVLFGKFAIHDELISLFSLSFSLEVGRWGLAFLQFMIFVFFGSNYGFAVLSMPLISGLYICVFLSGSVYLIAKLLDIKSPGVCALLGLVFVAYPVMAILFAYNFVASYDIFAFYLSILGAYWICTASGKKTLLKGFCVVVFSIGVYQAFFSITLAMILLYMMKEVYDRDDLSIAEFFSKGASRFGICVAAVVAYFAINWGCMRVSGTELSVYLNVDRLGREGWLYVKRIPVAYYALFNPVASFRLNTLFLYKAILFISVFLQFSLLSSMPSKKVFQILLLFLLFPPAVNFLYIVSPSDSVYGARIVDFSVWFGYLTVFVYLAFLSERSSVSGKRFLSVFGKTGYYCLAFMALMSCRIDNICYFQATFGQQRTINYFTTLVTRIKSAKGYRDEYPVVYLNERDKRVEDVQEMKTLDPVIPPYWGTGMVINNYAWKDFVSYWCAFTPETGRKEDFEGLPEVRDMPRYPDEGAIRVINGTVVVKF